MDISISCQNRPFFFICTSDPLEIFRLERLSLSLFMSRVGTNYENSSPSTYQLTFFTNFTNRGSYFHICYSFILNIHTSFFFLKQMSFEILTCIPMKRILKLKKLPNHSNLCCGIYNLDLNALWSNHNNFFPF